MDELQKEFLNEVSHLLSQCEESYLKLSNPDCRREELALIFRMVHSIKGAGGAVGYPELSAFAHIVENYLAVLRANPDYVDENSISVLLKAGDAFLERIFVLRQEENRNAWDTRALENEINQLCHDVKNRIEAEQVQKFTADNSVPASASGSSHKREISNASPRHVQPSTIKLDIDRLDSVLDLVGELVVIKSQLIQNEIIMASQSTGLHSVISMFDKTVRELHDKTLSMRMTSLKPLYMKVQRAVRDLSSKLGKAIELELTGEDTEIDRTMIELLGDPLVHLVRNAVDHGIESAEARKLSGKPLKACLRIKAEQAGSQVTIEIIDDGQGIDKTKVLQSALEKGLLAGRDLDAISETEAINLIFAPGFSTAKQVTDVSGRGVGLDVVKTNIERLRGRIDIKTKLGQGTSFKISIPFTTAITDGMVVLIDHRRYIIPINAIREFVQIEQNSLTQISEERAVIEIRGRFLPLVITRKILFSHSFKNLAPDDKSEAMVGVVEHGGVWLALAIDSVIGQSQFVIKTLGENFSHTLGIAGAAILGDGSVALVLDVDGLVQRHHESAGRQSADISFVSRERVA